MNWVGFLASWNDALCRELEDAGWFVNDESPVPWHLSPVVPNSVCRISLLSQEPLLKNHIVKRTSSDQGRIGSLAGDAC